MEPRRKTPQTPTNRQNNKNHPRNNPNHNIRRWKPKMKIKRQKGYIPIVITLETREEAKIVHDIFDDSPRISFKDWKKLAGLLEDC